MPVGWRRTPRRFCSDGCKMDAYALRRVARLLKGYSPSDVYEILMEAREKP